MSLTIVLMVLLGISEALGAIPQVKSNSIYQLVLQILKSLVALPLGKS
jgi:hypothetical protein